jgi:hypothetical protein
MKVGDFAEMQTHYTGANNKKKWIIKDSDTLFHYLELHKFRPGPLAKTLGISYGTVKRLLTYANLWQRALIQKQKTKGGKKRTAIADRFGYPYADEKHDYRADNGDIKRKFTHIVNAEEKYGRKLSDREVVHHINLLKFDNRPENIFICRDNGHHQDLHSQLEKVAAELVRLGIIKFHEDHGYYHNLFEVSITDE